VAGAAARVAERIEGEPRGHRQERERDRAGHQELDAAAGGAAPRGSPPRRTPASATTVVIPSVSA
jgi:hypothetical protein